MTSSLVGVVSGLYTFVYFYYGLVFAFIILAWFFITLDTSIIISSGEFLSEILLPIE